MGIHATQATFESLNDQKLVHGQLFIHLPCAKFDSEMVE